MPHLFGKLNHEVLVFNAEVIRRSIHIEISRVLRLFGVRVARRRSKRGGAVLSHIGDRQAAQSFAGRRLYRPIPAMESHEVLRSAHPLLQPRESRAADL